MEEQIAHNGATMGLDIQIAVHCHACPSRSTGKLSEQILPHVSAICQNAKALTQGVDEAVILTCAVHGCSGIASPHHVRAAIHNDKLRTTINSILNDAPRDLRDMWY